MISKLSAITETLGNPIFKILYLKCNTNYTTSKTCIIHFIAELIMNDQGTSI